MDEIRIDSIKIRSDLVGEFEKTNKLKGYSAECFLKKVFREDEDAIIRYLKKKWKLPPYIQFLANAYVEKYAKYLKDKEARQYIYEKYAEKQSIIDLFCGRLTELDATECLRLKEMYDDNLFNSDRFVTFMIIDEILKTYENELRLLIPDNINTVKHLK